MQGELKFITFISLERDSQSNTRKRFAQRHSISITK